MLNTPPSDPNAGLEQASDAALNVQASRKARKERFAEVLQARQPRHQRVEQWGRGKRLLDGAILHPNYPVWSTIQDRLVRRSEWWVYPFVAAHLGQQELPGFLREATFHTLCILSKAFDPERDGNSFSDWAEQYLRAAADLCVARQANVIPVSLHHAKADEYLQTLRQEPSVASESAPVTEPAPPPYVPHPTQFIPMGARGFSSARINAAAAAKRKEGR